MLVITPSWSSNLNELMIVPATPEFLAPFNGLAAHARAGCAITASPGEAPRGESLESSGLGLLAGLAEAPGQAVSFVARSRRRLVAALLTADALHRLAWRAQLKPAGALEAGPMIKGLNKLNPAYFQVQSSG